MSAIEGELRALLDPRALGTRAERAQEPSCDGELLGDLYQRFCSEDRARIAAAGGVFANVKMNQKIALLPEVDELFVDPAMSDMGTGTGAALAAAREAGDIGSRRALESVFLGPSYDRRAVDAAVAGSGLCVTQAADMPRRIAELLAAEKVVARFRGRMEYGPRALGHRSVLANARDRRVTDLLNDRLKRNDFMPFAPATLDEAAGECYIGAGSTIRDGLTIGDRALCGMGSVVLRDVPARTVVVGNPAKTIRVLAP